MIPCSFDDLIYPYYPAYTMGRYQIVISNDNGSKGFAICSAGLRLQLYHKRWENATMCSAF
jgi:hypothetical protein